MIDNLNYAAQTAMMLAGISFATALMLLGLIVIGALVAYARALVNYPQRGNEQAG